MAKVKLALWQKWVWKRLMAGIILVAMSSAAVGKDASPAEARTRDMMRCQDYLQLADFAAGTAQFLSAGAVAQLSDRDKAAEKVTKCAVSSPFLRRGSAAVRFLRQGVAGLARWRRVGAGADGIQRRYHLRAFTFISRRQKNSALIQRRPR